MVKTKDDAQAEINKMASQEGREVAMHSAMLAKINAETAKFVAQARLFCVEADVAEQNRDGWYPVAIQKGNAETQKLSAEARFYDSKSYEIVALVRKSTDKSIFPDGTRVGDR